MFAVMASNVHWQWTPNAYLAAAIAGGLAFFASHVLNELLAWRRKRGERVSRKQ
jgi:putative flippase GtrA